MNTDLHIACRGGIDPSSFPNDPITQFYRSKITDQQSDQASSIVIPVFRSFGLAQCQFLTTQYLMLGSSEGYLSRHPAPTDLLLGQATWLRCRVLYEPLAIPWCQNLACNTVMWRSRPGLRSSLSVGVECLSSARLLCGSVHVNLQTIDLCCMTLHCRAPR